MAKNNFIMHYEYFDFMEDFNDEEIGIVLRAVKNYFENKEIPELEKHLKMAFNFIKNKAEKEEKEYEKKCLVNKINGKKGGRPKNQKNPTVSEKTERNQTQPKKAKKADIDNDIDIDIDYDIDNDIDIFNNNINILIKNKESIKFSYLKNKENLELFLEKWNDLPFEDNEKIKIINYAIEISVKNNSPNIFYVNGILKNWVSQGKLKLKDILNVKSEEDNYEYKELFDYNWLEGEGSA